MGAGAHTGFVLVNLLNCLRFSRALYCFSSNPSGFITSNVIMMNHQENELTLSYGFIEGILKAGVYLRGTYLIKVIMGRRDYHSQYHLGTPLPIQIDYNRCGGFYQPIGCDTSFIYSICNSF